MLIGRMKLRGHTILATFVLAMLAIAMFPEIANAHGKANPMTLSTENTTNEDAGHVNKPTVTSSHCHSSIGQDCSTLIGFLVASHILFEAVGNKVSAPVYRSLRTGWLLLFDPPPPRALS